MILEQYIVTFRAAQAAYTQARDKYVADPSPENASAAGRAQSAMQEAWANLGWYYGTCDASGNPRN